MGSLIVTVMPLFFTVSTGPIVIQTGVSLIAKHWV